jgi:hypothetical protein
MLDTLSSLFQRETPKNSPKEKLRFLNVREAAINEQLQTIRDELLEVESVRDGGKNTWLLDHRSARTKQAKMTLEHQLQRIEREREMVREISPEEISYRKNILQEFPKALAHAPIARSLRFHGADILSSQDIIESGEISASNERGMDDSSHDAKGQISITTNENVILSLKDYTGISDYTIPMGCLFVLRPKDEEDARSQQSNMMDTVVFTGKNAGRLVNVVTSAEMIDAIRNLLREQGLNPQIAVEYHEYLATMQKNSRDQVLGRGLPFKRH